jgi:transcriptional regulator with XRE-family HTH domain/quercetin dioxygenase-like cupin family protein
MPDPIKRLGPRLKEVRLESKLSLREIARQLKVSPSFISQIENGKSHPSVATLYALANLLDVSIDVLFESKSADKDKSAKVAKSPKVSRATFDAPADAWDSSGARISFMNSSNRSVIVMNSGVRWERLAATADDSVNFMEIVYDAGSESNDSGELLIHDGYEYGFALDGEIEVTVGDLVQTISKGDSIGFDSTIPHNFRNTSKAPFRGIWFVHGCVTDPHR